MDSNIRVKCCCIINMNSFNKGGILSLVAENPVFINDLQSEAQILYQTLISQQNANPTAPIQKIYSQSGAWYTIMKTNIALSLLVTSQYPLTSAMRLLKQIEELVKRQINTGKYEFSANEPQIRDLLQAYDRDPFIDDKVDMTCKSVDSIQGLMEENLKKFQHNQQQLQVIHHKSEDISQMATQFQKGASQVNAKMSWQNYVAYGVIIAIICGVLLYLIVD